MIKLIRTFHAVGQGAFYSERFSGKKDITFNIVYDCGALPKGKNIDNAINGSFNDKDNIDILFISHFDSDHVNGVEILKNKCNIKNVVLPLLEDEEKAFLINLYKLMGGKDNHSLVKLIQDPQSFFGDNTKIISVKSIDIEENSPSNNTESEPNNIDDIGRKIHSGTPISFNVFDNTYFWIYCPYNYKYSKRHHQFIQELDKQGIAKDNLSDPDFISDKKKQTIIRKIYKSKCIDGNINENSMLVYSGPIKELGIYNKSIYMGRIMLCDILLNMSYYMRRSSACIYTGDSDLKIIGNDFINKIKEIKNDIGTIQVSHHGSHKNFNIDFFNQFEKPLICPISFGTKNTYGHPSDIVLFELYSHNHIPICVTELRGDSFFQYFDIDI